MKLVVTGGAGFIGSNFIRYVLAQHPQDSILNLDKLTYSGNLQTLRDVEKNERYTFVRGDIGDRRKVQEILSEGSTRLFISRRKRTLTAASWTARPS